MTGSGHRADGVRTLALPGGAYVVTCGGHEPALDDWIAQGLGTTRARAARYVVVEVRDSARLGAASFALLLDECSSLRRAGGDLWLVASNPRLREELVARDTSPTINLEATLADAVSAVNARLAL